MDIQFKVGDVFFVKASPINTDEIFVGQFFEVIEVCDDSILTRLLDEQWYLLNANYNSENKWMFDKSQFQDLEMNCAKANIGNDRCPVCGFKGTIGLNLFYCSNRSCRNN